MTVMLPEDTLAVLPLGKLCEDHGYTYRWTSGQKPQLIKKWQKDRLQYGEQRTLRCPWSIDKLFEHIFTYIADIFIARSRDPCTASRINKKCEYEWHLLSSGRPVTWTSRNLKPTKKTALNGSVNWPWSVTMLAMVRAWESEILRLTLRPEISAVESWVGCRKRTAKSMRIKWRKWACLPTMTEK